MPASVLGPDLILLAHRCYSAAHAATTASAIAIADGRIVALGTPRKLLKLRRRGTRVIDLGSATITPGLVDCHTHFFYWVLGRFFVIDLSAEQSRDAAVRAIRRRATSKQVGDWVLARGFDHNRWGTGLPCAADLDVAVRDRPVLARSHDGHTAWLNSAALRAAQIGPRTADPKGGRFVRDAAGRPTGIVQEAALDLLPDPLRDFALEMDARTQQMIDRALADAYRVAWAHGLVGVHVMDDHPSMFHLQRQRTEQKLGLRVVHAVPLARLGEACALGLRSGLGDDWFRIGGIKIFADGALGSQTAYMFDAYPGRGDYCGVPMIAGDELRATVCKLAQRGWTAWIHAIGDRAVHEAIQALRAARAFPTALPHRIEHAQCVRPGDVRRMARAGIVASVQPCHLLADIAIAKRHWPKAQRYAFPLRSMLSAGVTLAGGSDVPIETLDPRRSVFAAAVRTDEDGVPAGGWFPQQRLRAPEAIDAFTRGAATAAGLPPPAGTLAPGAAADLTVWADDPFRVAPSDLLRIGIRGCMVGGRLHLRPNS